MPRQEMPTNTTCPRCGEQTNIHPNDQTCDACGVDIAKVERERSETIRSVCEELKQIVDSFDGATLRSTNRQRDVVRVNVEFDHPVVVDPHADTDTLAEAVEGEAQMGELATLLGKVDGTGNVESWRHNDDPHHGSCFGMAPNTDVLADDAVVYLVGVSCD